MRHDAGWFSQTPHRCRLDWGRHGTRQAALRGDILVIVDTLSFSTAVVTAVEYGARIYPCPWEENVAELARTLKAEAAVHRDDVPAKGRFSLSPLSYRDLQPGARIVLPSPNGATCSRFGRDVPHLFVGALVNAEAVGAAVAAAMAGSDLCVTVIACGERWQSPNEDGELRFAIEDYLAAGAILSAIPCEKSPEARVCEAAFLHSRPDLPSLLWECGSGRELREKGYPEDVRHAAQLNCYRTVPVMREQWLVRLG
jgi:2-phosphosulfolactate phosphatase